MHGIAAPFEFLDEPTGVVPLEFIPELRPLRHKAVRRLQQDVFAAQFLDTIEQPQAVGFREVLDEAIKGDEVELFVDVIVENVGLNIVVVNACLLYTSPSPRDRG